MGDHEVNAGSRGNIHVRRDRGRGGVFGGTGDCEPVSGGLPHGTVPRHVAKAYRGRSNLLNSSVSAQNAGIE